MPSPRNLRVLSYRETVNLLLIGGLAGLVIGVAITVFYFSLVTFFGVQAKGLKALEQAQNGKRKTENAAAPEEKKAHASATHG